MNAIQLLQLPLFQGISEAAARQLLAEAPNSVRRYKEGDFIARQGDPCRSLYILCTGNVRAQMENAEGKQVTIDRISAPEVLAPAFIFASENRFPVNIEVQENCEVLVMHSQPVIMKNFIEMISDRSLFLSKKLNEFALQSLKSRLLNYLKINGRIDNQQEVAFILGVARPSLARALSELIAEKKVSMNGKEAIITE